MSLSLIRFEIISVLWDLKSQPKPSGAPSHGQNPSFAEEIDWVTEACRNKLESQYLKYCDMNVPFHWFTSTVARVMTANMWINVRHRFKMDRGGELTEQCKKRLFPISPEIVESCLLLEREKATAQWKWAIQNYIPGRLWPSFSLKFASRPSGLRCWIGRG